MKLPAKPNCKGDVVATDRGWELQHETKRNELLVSFKNLKSLLEPEEPAKEPEKKVEPVVVKDEDKEPVKSDKEKVEPKKDAEEATVKKTSAKTVVKKTRKKRATKAEMSERRRKEAEAKKAKATLKAKKKNDS